MQRAELQKIHYWQAWTIASLLSILFSSFRNHAAVSISVKHQSQTLNRYSQRVYTGEDANQDEQSAFLCCRRKAILIASTVVSTPVAFHTERAQAATSPNFLGLFQSGGDVYSLPPFRNVTTVGRDILDTPFTTVEQYLVRTLPVQNAFFTEIQNEIDRVSNLPAENRDKLLTRIQDLITKIDKQRVQLAPVFNPEEDSLLQILKGERGERLIEELRYKLLDLAKAVKSYNSTDIQIEQRKAEFALSQVGELLVAAYPYEVPKEGKFSYLPRLLGRAKVTFTFRRRKSILGNVTVLADGYIAPISAGCFLDLCIRGFYTGLPVKSSKRRLGGGMDFDVATIPILGSFGEGFYDPLTGKLRKVPYESLRIDRTTGEPRLSYSRSFASLPRDEAAIETYSQSQPLISFNIPGILGFMHPEKNENGGSAEFFSLQRASLIDEGKRKLLDMEYAPFGAVVDGMNIFEELEIGDVIDATYVDEWGELNLVKKKSSFSSHDEF